jgi:hypothetical protein
VPDLRHDAGQPGRVRERRTAGGGDGIRQGQPGDEADAGKGQQSQVRGRDAADAATDRVPEHQQAPE